MNHKVFAVSTIIIIAGVVYYISTDKTISDLLSNIKSFLWQLVHKNTIFDTLLVYSLIIFLVWLFTKVCIKIFKSAKTRIIVCSIISFISLISIVLSEYNWVMSILALETILSVFLLIFSLLTAAQNIGNVKEILDLYVKIKIPNIQLGILGLFATSDLISGINNRLETSIPLYWPSAFISLFYLAIQFKWYLCIFKGYWFIVNYTKNNVFFSFYDYYKEAELAYLNNSYEYASSVTKILQSKNKIFLMPFGEMHFINQELKKTLEKNIRANRSSAEIEKSLNTEFGKFGFEAIYKTVFYWIKGYEIDFKESKESIKRKKSEIGLGATEFVLMRYPIENHPLLKEGPEEKKDYITALNGLVKDNTIDAAKWGAKTEEYIKVFEVATLGDDIDNATRRFSDIIRRKEGLFRTVKSDYSYLLLLETIYFKNLLTEEEITYKEIETLFEQLEINKKYRDFIYRYIKSMYINGNVQEAEMLLCSKVHKNVRKVLEYVHNNIMWNERYVSLNQYNVAVCATMSAGKSTFINAMLGSDFIPAKNEACTAKVTTIRDNDNLNKIIGCYVRTDNTKVYSNIINGDVLNQWNDDVQVCETILEGNLEEIHCNGGILVMHDTPGTNNSEDTTHHDKTIEFLQQTPLDLIIYLINAEYISTNDTEILLREIQEIGKKKNFKIIFALNKIDSFDEEGDESLSNAIEDLHKQLISYGFECPVVFPFSANAARLFKLVAKEKELTKREQRNFDRLLELFTSFDASKYILGVTSESDSEAYQKLSKDKVLMINDKEYSYNNVIDALNHTGITNIENWLSENMEFNIQTFVNKKS